MSTSTSTPTNDTINKDEPVKGTKVEIVTQNISVRSIDRSKKDVSTWRNSHIAAESTINPNRTRLYDVYEDIMLDGFLFGIVSKRIDAVLNKKLCFKKDDTEVEGMEPVVRSRVFRDIIKEILLSKFWGISGLEFVPGRELYFRRIPRKHIKPKWQKITINESGTEGWDYTKLKNIWVVGDADDLGLLLPCGFYALLKKGAIADWAEYVEIFGSPMIVMTYDAGDTQTDKALDRVLDNIGNSMRIKLPKQAGLDVKDGKTSNGDGKLQDTFRQAMNQEMSIIILGNTETTSSGKGSGYAQSKTHAEQQLQITKTDMVDVLDYLNTPHFMDILRSYGLPVEGGHFVYDKEIDIDYMAHKITVDKELHAMGFTPDAGYIAETYAIELTEKEPEEKDEETPPQQAKDAPDLSDNALTVDNIAAIISATVKKQFNELFDTGFNK